MQTIHNSCQSLLNPPRQLTHTRSGVNIPNATSRSTGVYASHYYSLEFFAADRKGRGSGLSEAVVGSGLFLGPLVGGLLGQLVALRAAIALLGAGLVLLMAANALLALRARGTLSEQ